MRTKRTFVARDYSWLFKWFRSDSINKALVRIAVARMKNGRILINGLSYQESTVLICKSESKDTISTSGNYNLPTFEIPDFSIG